MFGRGTIENALAGTGLPVACRYGDCETQGFVKPSTDYGGWYKSKFYRFRKKWFCPEHYQKGRDIDNKFYQNWQTPDPYTEIEELSAEEELYNLLD